MIARRHKIVEKARTNPVAVVSPKDFQSEPFTEIPISEVITDPKFSLYCFDTDSESALFVELDDPLAVESAPFYYQAQYSHATALVSVPMALFHEVATQIPSPSKGVVFIHSVGRCGSTLLSKVLQGIPTVHSLSEPDDISQLGRFRTEFGFPDHFTEDLLASSVKWRCKSRVGQPPMTLAIKTRSEALVLHDMFARRFSNAAHVFLYRDGISWLRSVIQNWSVDRDLSDPELNRSMLDGWANILPLAKDFKLRAAKLNPVQIRILAWITCMEGYLSLRQARVPICAAIFEDLVTQPTSILNQLLEFSGIDGLDHDVMAEILQRDSQAGTVFDREERKKRVRVLTDEWRADAERIIADRPLLADPGVRLPGTLKP